jgi:hypothetical protein
MGILIYEVYRIICGRSMGYDIFYNGIFCMSFLNLIIFTILFLNVSRKCNAKNFIFSC